MAVLVNTVLGIRSVGWARLALRLYSNVVRRQGVGESSQDFEMKPDSDLAAASKRLGVTIEAVRMLTVRGTLAHRRVKGKIMIPESELKRLLGDRQWRSVRSRRRAKNGSS